MEKVSFFLISACLFSAGTANGQSISATKVPAIVKAAFSRSHPGTKASWEIEDGYYEAAYHKGKLENSVFYSKSGRLVKSETGITLLQLPKAANDYLTQNFAKKKFDEVVKLSYDKGTINYFVVVKDSHKAIVFDNQGKYLKTVSD